MNFFKILTYKYSLWKNKNILTLWKFWKFSRSIIILISSISPSIQSKLPMSPPMNDQNKPQALITTFSYSSTRCFGMFSSHVCKIDNFFTCFTEGSDTINIHEDLCNLRSSYVCDVIWREIGKNVCDPKIVFRFGALKKEPWDGADVANGYFHHEHLFSLVWIFVCIATFRVGFTFIFRNKFFFLAYFQPKRQWFGKNSAESPWMCEKNTSWDWKDQNSEWHKTACFLYIFLQLESKIIRAARTLRWI